jgi:hypothetical protein
MFDYSCVSITRACSLNYFKYFFQPAHKFLLVNCKFFHPARNFYVLQTILTKLGSPYAFLFNQFLNFVKDCVLIRKV